MRARARPKLYAPAPKRAKPDVKRRHRRGPFLPLLPGGAVNSPTLLLNALVVAIFAVALLRLEQAPSCLQCSGKLRHRADCPQRRDGDA